MAPMPPPPSLTTTTSTTIAAMVGGHHAPLWSVPSRWMLLVIVDVTDHGRWRHKGVWGVVECEVEEECPCHCIHSSGSDPTWGGRWGEEEQHDIGGIMWLKMLGWGRKRRRRCAARVTAMTKKASGEGGGEGEVDMEGRRGRGLLSGPHHSN